MRQQQEEVASQETTKQTQDAMIRRLDNERQYLKSQLASEIALKNDLQKELVQVIPGRPPTPPPLLSSEIESRDM